MELRAGVSLNSETLSALTRKHLSNCPDCQDYYLEKLEELESYKSSAEENNPN